MQEAVVCYKKKNPKKTANNTSTMVHGGKCKNKLSQHMIEMLLEINYRLRSKTRCMSHTSPTNQTPTAPTGKPFCPHACAHLQTALIKRVLRQLRNKTGENTAEREETWDNLTSLFLTQYNKTTRDCSVPTLRPAQSWARE